MYMFAKTFSTDSNPVSLIVHPKNVEKHVKHRPLHYALVK